MINIMLEKQILHLEQKRLQARYGLRYLKEYQKDHMLCKT